MVTALVILLQMGAPGVPTDSLRSIAVDERLAADAGLRIGDQVVISPSPFATGDAPAETVRVSAFVRRRADPSEVATGAYRIRLHLDHIQSLLGQGDRIDRFAVAAEPGAGPERAHRAINDAAFGFRAHLSRDIAAETSQTFRVVSRFHRAIGVITIVASAIFLLCILLIKVEERRRDVAALRLMGISRTSVMGAVVIEAALVALLGSALGVGIGALSSAAVNAYYQAFYRTPLRFAIVTPDIILLAATLSLALGVIAGALAALRLVRTPPLVLLGR